MKLTHKWMPVIEVKKRTGRGLGVDACGRRSMMMEGKLAVLTIPEACGGEGHCIGLCADEATRMARLPWEGDTSHENWRTSEERGAAVHPAGFATAYSGGTTCQS